MHGVDPDDDSAWIGGLVIDRAHQRRGIGRAVVDLLVARAAAEGRASALSYEPANTVAKALYERAGFVETGEREGDEVVARRPLTRLAAAAVASGAMTDALYSRDAYLRSCEATVVDVRDDGVVLDRTVFYARGGGQPGDSGVLRWGDGECRVLDTTKSRDDGEIVHAIDPAGPRHPSARP